MGLGDSCHSLALLNLLTWKLSCYQNIFYWLIVCDVIIRVSFKVSFPYLYILKDLQSRMRLCYKRYYFHVCALFFLFSSILSLPQKITPGILYSLSIFVTLCVFHSTLRVTNLVLKGVRLLLSRIPPSTASVTAAKWIDSWARLQFRFFLNLFSCLLTTNLSRRNNRSRAGPQILFNSWRNGNRQWILITFHVYLRSLAATRDVN